MDAERIARASREASEILHKIRSLSGGKLETGEFEEQLRRAICKKLDIEYETESQLRRLVILSIKKKDRQSACLPDEVVGRQIRSYDCHQTSLLAQRKVLLLMFLERELGVRLEDEEAAGLETVEELARALAKRMKGEMRDGCG